MKDYIGAYFTGESKITDKQRKSLDRMTFIKKPKKAKVSGNGGYWQNKFKFYCPEKKDTYLASGRHTHCKLCYDNYRKQDLHEVIKFEERKV